MLIGLNIDVSEWKDWALLAGPPDLSLVEITRLPTHSLMSKSAVPFRLGASNTSKMIEKKGRGGSELCALFYRSRKAIAGSARHEIHV